ncbi:Bcr/CflA family efflux MFS transporter [Cupriavidus gilardii]|uniref:Bcr/CflA family efflux MFS transporter n=1 Tax=Cupriavidus gilardii TaxID=82541 RepID=UPI0020C5F325|nr:Bcr/CflA family efflux MFS transporter [Cupriavidus gilardii]
MQDMPVDARANASVGAAAVATPTHTLRGSTLAMLGGLAALGALATNIILPAFPAMGASLGVPVADLGAALSSFFLAFAVGQLAAGPLSDRWGRQPLVLGGLAVFIVGSLICAAADTLGMLIAGRVVQAFGVCAASVLSRAIARDLFDGAALARALALTMVAMAAAPGFSPLIGSALDSWLGWRSAFVALAVAAAALAIHYRVCTGETHAPDRRQAVSMGKVLRGYLALLGDRRFILPAGAVGLMTGNTFTFFAAAPRVLMGKLGLSSLALGLFFAITVFVVFAAGFLAPRLAKARGPRPVAMSGLVIAAAGGAALMAVPGTSLAGFVGAIAVFLFGMGLVNPLATAMTLQPFGREAGAASALLGFLQMFCAALGTTLASQPSDTPARLLGMVIAAASIVGLLLFLRTRAQASGGTPAG